MSEQNKKPLSRPHLWLIRIIGVIVPRRLRADWRQEWEAELRYRERMLVEWDRLDWRNKLELLRRSASAFWDAVVLQPQRLEDEMFQDLRFGARMLLKNKGFTAIATLTLALGIGANTAIFSVVNSVLLNPLPFEQSDRLVMVWDDNADLDRRHEGPSPGNYQDLRSAPGIFAASAAWYVTARTLTSKQGAGQDAEQVQCALVTPDFFTTLRAQAASGSVFSAAQTEGVAVTLATQYASGDRLVVISDALWRRRLGASPDAVGATLTINGADWRVQGIMPPQFAMPEREVDLWMPWDLSRTYGPHSAGGLTRNNRLLKIVARLQPGQTPEQTQERLTAFSVDLAERHPKENKGWRLRLTPLLEERVGKTRPLLVLLLVAVAAALLIACANVAGLWLARAAVRQRETAVRAALGATRTRLLRQWLTESLLLAALGGATGLALARYGLNALLALAPAGVPRLDEVAVDRRVLLFTLAVTALTGLLTGLFPALRNLRGGLAPGLKDGGEKGSTPGASQCLRQALVVAQIALALMTLVGAGLLARSFARLIAIKPGFETRNLLTMHISLDGPAYGRAQTTLYYERLLERLRALPGVVAAAAVSVLPMSGVETDFERPYWRAGESEPGAAADKVALRMATPEYFPTLGIPLLAGRNFNAQDRADTPAVILVSESFAGKVWPGESAVGKQLMIDFLRGKNAYEVVGVTRDIRYFGLRSKPQPEVFFPHAQIPYLPMNVVVRTAADPLQLAGAARRVARELDATQPVSRVNTMEQLIQRSIAPDRFALALLGLLALLALLIANVGIYSALSYTVAARAHEIGVRLALGATSRDVLRLALGQGMRLALIGIALGLLSACALTRLMRPLLFGVSATDPLTLIGGALSLALVAWLACYLPARRATKVDPLVALRHE
jgi:putative ABC transport system permease protein